MLGDTPWTQRATVYRQLRYSNVGSFRPGQNGGSVPDHSHLQLPYNVRAPMYRRSCQRSVLSDRHGYTTPSRTIKFRLPDRDGLPSGGPTLWKAEPLLAPGFFGHHLYSPMTPHGGVSGMVERPTRQEPGPRHSFSAADLEVGVNGSGGTWRHRYRPGRAGTESAGRVARSRRTRSSVPG